MAAAWRGLRSAAEWTPLTLLGLVLIPVLIWLLRSYALDREDRILLAVCVGGLGLIALSVVIVLITSLVLQMREEPRGEPPLDLAAGTPFFTGYHLRWISWIPFVRVDLAWESPTGVDARLYDEAGRLAEVISASDRCQQLAIVRRIRVSDVFGLARIVFRWTAQRKITILPDTGPMGPMTPLQQICNGDLLAQPEGSLEGDLVEMRSYAPGDPLKWVLWKIYARTGKLLVRMPERAVSPCDRLLAYFVAGAHDEPTAGVTRGLLERGALGDDFLFCADGEPDPTPDAVEAVMHVVRSSNHRAHGGEGLEALYHHPQVQAMRSCILFVPAALGPWLERIETHMRAHPGSYKAVLGIDGLAAAPRRWSVARWLVKQPPRPRFECRRADVRVICERLTLAGAEVVVVDRRLGVVLDPDEFGVFAAREAEVSPRRDPAERSRDRVAVAV